MGWRINLNVDHVQLVNTVLLEQLQVRVILDTGVIVEQILKQIRQKYALLIIIVSLELQHQWDVKLVKLILILEEPLQLIVLTVLQVNIVRKQQMELHLIALQDSTV